MLGFLADHEAIAQQRAVEAWLNYAPMKEAEGELRGRALISREIRNLELAHLLAFYGIEAKA